MKTAKKGHVYLVGAGPGDPGLLTVYARTLIRSADVILYDRLINPGILKNNHQAEHIYVGKAAGNHSWHQEAINQELVRQAQLNKVVVRLKGGDPFVFGRGGEEAATLAHYHIPFEIVPGISSVIAAPAYAGIPVTHRGVSEGFTVVSGHHPSDISQVDPNKTTVLLMGLGHLKELASRLMDLGYLAQTPVALIQWGTWVEQQTVTLTLEDLCADDSPRGLSSPLLIVVGDVVRQRSKLAWFTGPEVLQRVIGIEDLPRELEVWTSAHPSLDVITWTAQRVVGIGPSSWQWPMDLAMADNIVFENRLAIPLFMQGLRALKMDIRGIPPITVPAGSELFLEEWGLFETAYRQCENVKTLTVGFSEQCNLRIGGMYPNPLSELYRYHLMRDVSIPIVFSSPQAVAQLMHYLSSNELSQLRSRPILSSNPETTRVLRQYQLLTSFEDGQ